jgi:glycosyltransferase involved in cell wall biosynthesis
VSQKPATRERQRLSVVIPAYNEEGSTEKTIQRSLEALRDQFEDFEIIIVNDGSSDRTGEIADTLAAEHPEVRVIHNERNLGAGASLVRGLRHAKHELIVHNGMDYPFDFEDLRKMVPLLAEADVVVAVKSHRAGYSLFRNFTSEVNRGLLRLLFGVPVTDYTFVQLYKREVLDTVSLEWHSSAFLTSSIIIQAWDMGFRIREIEIECHPRLAGKATTGSPKVILGSLCDMMRFRLRRRELASSKIAR